MKPLKLTVLIIVVIIVLFLAVPFFLPGTVVITQNQCMKAVPELPFLQVNELKNWENWSPFTDDSTAVITYNDIANGVGAGYSWKGQKLGKGSLAIVKSEPYRYIETKIDFGPQGTVKGSWNFQPANDSTCVTWSLTIDNLKYPFGRWLGLMIKGGMKPMMKNGLVKMKEIVEPEQKSGEK